MYTNRRFARMSRRPSELIAGILVVATLVLLGTVLNGCSQNEPVVESADDSALEMLALRSQKIQTVSFPLDSIVSRDTLRVLTRNSAYTYFLHRGTEMGFEYELIKDFAEKLGVHVKMIVPPRWDDMIPWLLEGRGDIIAAAMTVTPERAKQVAFSEPYNSVYQVVLTRAGGPRINAPEDLIGKQVHVRAGSSYYRRLQELNKELGGGIKIVAVPEYYDTEYIIELLMDRVIDITVADVNIARLEQSHYDSIRINTRISADENLAWAVRPNADALLDAMNEYIGDLYTSTGRSAFFNILTRRYFLHVQGLDTYKRSLQEFRADGRISRYDHLFEKYATQYGFSFSLITAQAYHESRFNPRASSWVGAKGIMQIMPRTGEALGVKNLSDPEQNIEAGVRYLRELYDRFDSTLHPHDRLAFALASYNVGYGHVRDARLLANEDGLNPNVWQGNVEWMLLNLSRQKYYERTAAGYARGHEAVNYVNDIMNRARTYQALLDGRLEPTLAVDILAEGFSALAVRPI
ncbi:MAG TPA: membrane-bound lytic murein transglycosylase MltF [Firmicutes bacterium]|nr:membrane-bound lytic murein transglycosylase MltF [Bacillota bacterium]